MFEGDSRFKHDLERAGYSKEEEYFYLLNRELIEQRRKEIDAKHAEKSENRERQATCWMKCPNCGHSMDTKNLFNILVDQCTSCHGIFINRDEAETLLRTQKSRPFFAKLKKLFELRDETPQLF
jgi:Zn-finger nucleic acid-binding protein